MPSPVNAGIIIDSAFPGGNIIVESIQDGVVILRQDLRDTQGDWFYWYFAVRGAEPGSTWRFQFSASPAMGVRGPGVSRDKGKTWRWLGADSLQGNGFSYTFPADYSPSVQSEDEVRFSFGMPYLLADWDRFIDRLEEQQKHQDPARFTRHVLCRTRQNREVPYIRLNPSAPDESTKQGSPSSSRKRVLLTARHHSCEMMANYVLEGLIEEILRQHGDPAESGNPLRSTEFLIIPFVDMDGVENGDQGKWRAPHDHNRDYDGGSLYAEVVAMKQLVPEWQGSGSLVCLDIHCPYIGGENNESIYLVGSGVPAIAREQERFSALLETYSHSGLPCFRDSFLPFGQSWNTAENYIAGKSFIHWIVEQPGVELAATIEIPYATAHGAEVNAKTARDFGHDLARAIKHYLSRPASAR
ncbi:MAG TPA: M14 family zinc carboxypeptidase [Candidatus Methylacidiphilales bacterium]|nr:M14 family zinc carboxypeptidase [Candidatus Methylacidiphilales bacterium]